MNQENKWIQPINNFDDVCWTIIASKINNSNARISQNGYFVDKDLVEIHCKIGQKKICEQDKTEIIIPHFSMQITDQHGMHTTFRIFSELFFFFFLIDCIYSLSRK